MSRKTKPGKGGAQDGGKGPSLPPEDREEWREAMKDVAPLPARPARHLAKKPAKIAVPQPRNAAERTNPSRAARLPKDASPENIAAQPGLDRGTDDRLRRGQLPVQGRLDLHGMTQAQAARALDEFLRRSYERGRRCVLIITGKGARRPAARDAPWYEPQPGILRDRVPEWLRGKHGAMVLRFYPAQARHGGDGALYVLLRRRRDGGDI